MQRPRIRLWASPIPELLSRNLLDKFSRCDGMSLQRGSSMWIFGTLEIDGFGNLNTTLLKDDSGMVRYFNGSAGGNDTASLARRVIVIMRHENASCGRPWRTSRVRACRGTWPPGTRPARRWPHRLITDKAVIGFDPDTHAAMLLSLHSVARLEDVVETLDSLCAFQRSSHYAASYPGGGAPAPGRDRS